MHDLESRIERLYRRDQWIAATLVIALVATLWNVWWATQSFAAGKVRALLAAAGAVLLLFNGSSIWALLKHNREDKTFIYTLDIKHLDEYRIARAARKSKRGTSRAS
jgi:hypothetical protein